MTAVAAPVATGRPRFRLPSQLVVGWIALVLLGVVTLGPLAFIVLGSLEGGAWRAGVIESPAAHNAIFYSLLLALRAPAAAIIGFAIAWILIRLAIPGRSWIEFGFWVAFFIPSLSAALGWILMLDPNYGLFNQILQAIPGLSWIRFNIYSLFGIQWVHMTMSTVPIMVILLGPALRNLDSSLEESARTAGASPRRFFFKITLPLLAPAILAGTLGAFIRGLEAFEVEQLLGVPAGIYVFGTLTYDLVNWEPPLMGQAMALSTILLFMLLVLAVLYQQFANRRTHATISGRGSSFSPMRVGKVGGALSGALFTMLSVMILIPIASLVVGSMMTIYGYFNLEQTYTLIHWERLLDNPVFLRTLRSTFLLGLGAATVGVVTYSLLAFLITRTNVVGRQWIDLMTWIPWAIPGILLGFSLLVIVLEVPLLSVLYGSLLVMIIASAISSMPLGVQMMKTAMGQVSVELEQASQICGASRLRTLRRVMLPIVRPMLVSIFVLAFISGMRDTGTVILLSSAQTLTLPILSLQYSIAGQMGSATAVSVVMTFVIIVVAFIARFFGLSLGENR